MSLGLPSFVMEFKSKGVSAIERSARGIVACILKDNTDPGNELSTFRSIDEVEFSKWKEENFGFLKLIFAGTPSKVIALRVAEETEDFAPALKKLKNLRWNYLTIPSAKTGDNAVLSAWIKAQRDNDKKTFKIVLPKCKGDHEGIINFTTENITSDITGKKHTAAEYSARIAGLLAGLSLERSSTFYVLNDVSSADVPDDADTRIDAGEFIIVFDGKEYKIGRGVNSLTSFTKEKKEDMRFIKIIEGMDLYYDDLKDTHDKFYVGKTVNDYDSKQAFVAAISAYHKELEGNVLDKSFNNTAAVSLEGQGQYLETRGIDTSKMSEIKILQANTGTEKFIECNVKFVNASEDAKIRVNV